MSSCARIGLLFIAAALAACPTSAPERARLEVYAAASLTEVFRALEEVFERRHPEVDVALTFGGSQVLRLQIERGAPADVFVAADADHVEGLARAGHVRRAQTVARNELVLVVPGDVVGAIGALAELPRAERVVLGTESVPVGRYARSLLRRAAAKWGAPYEAAVLAHVVSEEPNVRLVRAKVELGEADAAFLYRTDALSSPRLRVIPIPPDLAEQTEVRAAVLEGARDPSLAEAWLELALSPEGRSVLAAHGFSTEAPTR